ncbi:MAG TPA: hypothetical protein VM243_04660 [Phycisphaerae bacterium]|nr:hypothetical protein [Phycisphaerae bacterium]
MADRAVRVSNRWVVDASIALLIAVVWCLWLAGPVRRQMPVADDTFRDAAYVENILAGRVLEDPSMAGFSWWYAPGGPLFYAGVSRLTGVSPIPLYRSSILWANVLIPVGLFLLVRLYWDRATAVAALLMVWLGSRWWQTHLAMPMPSIQGLIPALVALMVWRRALQGKWGRPALLGVVLAACTWHHMISAIVVSGAIGIQTLLWAVADRGGLRYGPLRSAAVAGGVCAVLIVPLAWHLLAIPWNNSAHSALAAEMDEPAYALHAATPLVIPLAVLGVILVGYRPASPTTWVLGYLVVGLIGQGAGYLHRMWQDLPLPVLLPHEFQWHGQLAVGILAGVGLIGLSRWIAGRLKRRLPARMVTVVAAALLMVLVVAPDRLRAIDRVDDYWTSGRCSPDVAATMEWVRSSTEITDVFVCRYLPAYYDLVGWTGRKLILMPEARANIAADVLQRRRDLHRLETTTDPEEFLAVAVDRYGAGYAYLTSNKKNLLERWSGWDIFETAYRSPNGERTILRIKDNRVLRPE